MSQQRDRLRVIATALAAVALAIVLVAVLVVGHRSGAAPSELSHVVVEQPPRDVEVKADDVIKLERAVETIGGGVHVTDAELEKRLGLHDDDVITSIDGRAIAVSDDIHEAMFEIAMLKAQTLYVEVLRDHGPALVRWRVQGDLREARYVMPSMPLPRDPLLDTITKVDDTHYVVPQATATQLVADRTKFFQGVRIVPAMHNGRPNGFKLYAIRPASVIARFGFANGDTVQSINGRDLGDPTSSDLFDELKDARMFIVAIERRGYGMNLTITVD